MKWKVENALSRDVERQHLNKILKDIRAAIDAAAPSSVGMTEAQVRQIVRGMLPPKQSVAPYTLTLSGDVSGSVTVNGRDITLDTTLEVDVVPEAPDDGYPYWRRWGYWELVPDSVFAIATLTTAGFVVTDPDMNQVYSRTFEAEPGELTVQNADGTAGNVLYGLADVVNTGVGVGPVKIYTRDDKGRIEGDEDADTDNLPEGSLNLYHTDERAQDAVGSILTDSADIVFNYDDVTPEISADLHPDVWDVLNNVLSVVGSPTDADIIEYDTIAGGWVPKKNPRELIIDGGNF